MSTLASLFQQSNLIENVYQGLKNVMHGADNLQSTCEIHEDEAYHNAFFASHTWSFIQTGKR